MWYTPVVGGEAMAIIRRSGPIPVRRRGSSLLLPMGLERVLVLGMPVPVLYVVVVDADKDDVNEGGKPGEVNGDTLDKSTPCTRRGS